MTQASMQDILRAREQRARLQETLRKRYALPVLSYTLNIAGPVKTTPLLRRGFGLGLGRLLAQLSSHGFDVAASETLHGPAGDTWVAAIHGEAFALKAVLIRLEDEDAFARLMDLDVTDAQGEKLSRASFGLPPRLCLLCSGDARLCGRSRKHTAQALFEAAERLTRDALALDFADWVAAQAQRALLYELCTTPKPGLVDLNNSGAHRDMNLFTFLDSISCLTPFFRDCALQGLRKERGLLLDALRELGRRAELAMLAATVGVNTHKGAIFALGLLCGLIGARQGREKDIDGLLSDCAAFASPLLEELTASQPISAGEKRHVSQGLTGARGEAASGFASVRLQGLPALREALAKGLRLEEAGLRALLSLMVTTEDSNLLKRGTPSQRAWVAQRAEALLSQDRLSLPELLALDREMTALNLSPGGCADLLAVCYFLHFVESGYAGP